jgi:glucose 1-dehydrogenase
MTQKNIRRLDGIRALVTGASSGLGFEIARELAGAGTAVAINYLSHPEVAQKLADDIKAAGGKAIAVQGDVSLENDVARMFAETVAAFGGFDLLIANAGWQQDAGIASMTLQQWQGVINVNLTGQFLCCREAVRIFRSPTNTPPAGMRARGNIICMSSVHQIIPWAGHVNYAASKGGVQMMMETLAQEVAKDKIRVNSVAPGAIRTPINKPAWDTPEALQKLLKLVPYGRIGEPEDIARAVIWLASDEADYITGTTLFVDGGMELYPGFEDNG